jgi:hypothetical protein
MDTGTHINAKHVYKINIKDEWTRHERLEIEQTGNVVLKIT